MNRGRELLDIRPTGVSEFWVSVWTGALSPVTLCPLKGRDGA